MASEETEFRLKNYLWVLLLMTAVFFYMLFAWNIDISTSALLNENSINKMLGASVVESYLTNGFWYGNPVQVYHIGLIGSTILFMLTAIWVYMVKVENAYLKSKLEQVSKNV